MNNTHLVPTQFTPLIPLPSLPDPAATADAQLNTASAGLAALIYSQPSASRLPIAVKEWVRGTSGALARLALHWEHAIGQYDCLADELRQSLAREIAMCDEMNRLRMRWSWSAGVVSGLAVAAAIVTSSQHWPAIWAWCVQAWGLVL